MNDNEEKLLGENNGGASSFDALRGSLANIHEAWKGKPKQATGFLTAVEVDDFRSPWRKDLGERLECTPCHVFIVSLLLIDLLATALDILKTIHNKTHDLSHCTTLVETCQCVREFDYTESWEFLYWLSIGILTVLFLNVLLLLVAWGFHFFRHPGYILDAIVVITALGLEIFLDSDTVGLLIILTLWRIVRVAHGIFEVTDEAWEKEVKQFEDRLNAAEEKHDRDQELLYEKDRRIAELERERHTRADNDFHRRY